MTSEAAPVVPVVEAALTSSEVGQEPPTAAPKPAAPPLSEKPTPATAQTPLSQLFTALPSIVSSANHSEIWGVTLSQDKNHVPTSIVLEKFLRANDRDVTKAKAQLIEALKWRKEMQPAELLDKEEFDPAKFGSLGYVTTYESKDVRNGGRKEIVTWNIYGAVKDLKSTFGDVKESALQSSSPFFPSH